MSICVHVQILAQNLSLFSLKNHGADQIFEPMFEMGRETMSLPFEEKMKYWQGNQGASFG